MENIRGTNLDQNQQAQNEKSKLSKQSPWHIIPAEEFICIEHPCIVTTPDAGIRSLGGAYKISQFYKDTQKDKFLEISLRPNDHIAKRLPSRTVGTHEVLMKVSLPKRTGRKRKRGSSDPFTEPSEGEPTSEHAGTKGLDSYRAVRSAEELSTLLQDQLKSATVVPIGRINERYRFRGLPDFQYAPTTNLCGRLRSTLLSSDFNDIKRFKINLNPSSTSIVDLGPSPSFSQSIIPFNYQYLQNPAVKFAKDESGRAIAYNAQAPVKNTLQAIPMNAKTVPCGPNRPLVPEHKQHPVIQEAIKKVRAALDERPITTRRMIFNRQPFITEYRMRLAYPYVGYHFRHGPWRDAIIKYGVDPRSDPQYRIYQTLFFKLSTERERNAKKQSKSVGEGRVNHRSIIRQRAKEENTHIFDGRHLFMDGNIWQACDITDPLLRRILDTTNIRSECEVQADGWYQNGTWAKVRVIMRDKIDALLVGRVPSDVEYTALLGISDVLNEDTVQPSLIGRKLLSVMTPKQIHLTSAVRALAKGVDQKMKKLAKGKARVDLEDQFLSQALESEREDAEDSDDSEEDNEGDEDDSADGDDTADTPLAATLQPELLDDGDISMVEAGNDG